MLPFKVSFDLLVAVVYDSFKTNEPVPDCRIVTVCAAVTIGEDEIEVPNVTTLLPVDVKLKVEPEALALSPVIVVLPAPEITKLFKVVSVNVVKTTA
jgi:hypothetical protein